MTDDEVIRCTCGTPIHWVSDWQCWLHVGWPAPGEPDHESRPDYIANNKEKQQ